MFRKGISLLSLVFTLNIINLSAKQNDNTLYNKKLSGYGEQYKRIERYPNRLNKAKNLRTKKDVKFTPHSANGLYGNDSSIPLYNYKTYPNRLINKIGSVRYLPGLYHNSLYNNIKVTRYLPGLYRNTLYNPIIFRDLRDRNYPDVLHNVYSKHDLKVLNDAYADMYEYQDSLHRLRIGHINYYLVDMYYSRKKHSAFREFLNGFRFHISMGGGYTYCKTVFNGLLFYRNGDYYLTSQTGHPREFTAYRAGIFGKPYLKVPMDYNDDFYQNVSNDKKIFVGDMCSLPLICLGISRDVMKRLRFEVKYSIIANNMRVMKRNYMGSKVTNYVVNKYTGIDTISMPNSAFWSSQIAFIISPKIINSTFWSLSVDLIIGGSFIHNVENFFNILDSGFMYGAGMTLERHISEYISLFWGFKWDFTKYQFTPSNSGEDESWNVKNYLTNFGGEFGISFRIPYIDHCENQCSLTKLHIHDGYEYRGIPVTSYRANTGEIIHNEE